MSSSPTADSWIESSASCEFHISKSESFLAPSGFNDDDDGNETRNKNETDIYATNDDATPRSSYENDMSEWHPHTHTHTHNVDIPHQTRIFPIQLYINNDINICHLCDCERFDGCPSSTRFDRLTLASRKSQPFHAISNIWNQSWLCVQHLLFGWKCVVVHLKLCGDNSKQQMCPCEK